MKKQFLIQMLVLGFLSSLPGQEMPHNFVLNSSFGRINIFSQEPKIQVYLDEHFVGHTPLSGLQVKPGHHRLVALNPRRLSWLDQDWVQEFDINAGDTLNFNVAFKIYCYLNSIPFGAQVICDGKEIGQTPLFFPFDQNHLLILRKEGYLDYVLELPKNEKRRFFNVFLQVDQASEQEKLRYSVQVRQKRHRNQLMTYSAMGLSVASGLAAIYFKTQADERYHQYLETGDLQKMNYYYNETKRFDKLAGASYGVFQVSFVVTIYLYLSGKK